MKLFVDLDISSEKIDDRLSVTSDLNGAAEIKTLILKHHNEVVFERIVIGLESISLYSFYPACFFMMILI